MKSQSSEDKEYTCQFIEGNVFLIMKGNKLLARYITLRGVRNTELEELHCGTFSSIKTGDYSDVKIFSPFGEIPWTEVSRISDQEMRKLMLDV